MNKQNEIILSVAEAISEIVPQCCGVTLGGSRAYGFEDDLSDVEMYFYSNEGIPSLSEITRCLKQKNALHKRCNEFLWNEEPWGPHSFFVIDNLYFEIGYRNVNTTFERICRYQNGEVAPLQDCHDLGLGYLLSGLVASVVSEKELILCGDEISRLKQQAMSFSSELLNALKVEYLDTAKSLLYGKLLSAAQRADIFFYDVIAGRITRSLIIMAFAKSNKHFPGDKWNERLLLSSTWGDAASFIDNLRRHALYEASTASELLQKREYLIQALYCIEKE